MRAVRMVSLEGPGALEVTDVPEPQAGPGELLVEVRAAGVTYPDVLRTRGRYQVAPDLPYVLGSQLAGTVRSAPAGSGLTAGQRVCGFTMTGAFAEVAAVQVGQAFPLPDTVSWETAAATPINHFTAHFVLALRGRLVVVGFVGGDIPTVKVNRLLLGNTEVVGAGWGEYALRRPGYAQQQWAWLAPRLGSGELAALVADTLPLERATDALRLLDKRTVIGNVVLTP